MRNMARRIPGRRALGNYGTSDLNANPAGESISYNDDVLFNPPPARLLYAPPTINKRFTPFPFRIGAASKLILPDNPRRASLLIQNRSATLDLFINFGTTADELSGFVIPGGLSAGILLDIFCPKNAFYASFPAATTVPQLGIVFEGTEV